MPTVNIKEIRKEADSYSKKAREIDNKIQAANWKSNLGPGEVGYTTARYKGFRFEELGV